MRYAVYLMPDPASALWREGSALLGYDAARSIAVDPVCLPGRTTQTMAEAMRDPRRYGLHMTLKAPFRLADGRSEADLLVAVDALATRFSPIDLTPLMLDMRSSSSGGGFCCLAPSSPQPTLGALEDATVRALDAFRAPLTAKEIERRRPDRLSERQRDLLDRFGYPFVLDEFRPHFSLTGMVDEPERWFEDLRVFIAGHPAMLDCRITGLAVFIEPGADAPFHLCHFAPFRA
jgi:hypothetical protein